MSRVAAPRSTAPSQVAAYGACVRAKIDDGALERDACAREFAALKKCFQEVRVK